MIDAMLRSNDRVVASSNGNIIVKLRARIRKKAQYISECARMQQFESGLICRGIDQALLDHLRQTGGKRAPPLSFYSFRVAKLSCVFTH